MTTPPSLSGRYGNAYVNGHFGYYSLGPGPHMAQVMPYSFQTLPHQLPYPYVQGPQSLFVPYQPFQNIRAYPVGAVGTPEVPHSRPGEDLHRGQPPKI